MRRTLATSMLSALALGVGGLAALGAGDTLGASILRPGGIGPVRLGLARPTAVAELSRLF